MEDFEKKLKSIALAGPGKDLRDRIFAQESEHIRFSDFIRLRIPVGWAAVLVFVALLTGMYGSRVMGLEPVTAGTTTQIQIIRAASERNFLDFTSNEGMDEFMWGELTVSVEKPEEI